MNKIKIGTSIYDIEFKDEINEGGKILYGDIHTGNETIRIWANAPGCQVEEALLHETIHGISFDYELGLKERQVELVARGLVRLILDNDGFIEQLCKNIKKKMKKREEGNGKK